MKFREEVRRALGGGEELTDNWETTTKIVRGIARKALRVTSG